MMTWPFTFNCKKLQVQEEKDKKKMDLDKWDHQQSTKIKLNMIMGCKYPQFRSQQNCFIKGLWIVFKSIFISKNFWMNCFATYYLKKIHTVAPIYYMFFVYHGWLNMNFSMCKY